MQPTKKVELIEAWERFLVSLGYSEIDRQEILEFIGLLSSAVELNPLERSSRDRIEDFVSKNWLEANR